MIWIWITIKISFCLPAVFCNLCIDFRHPLAVIIILKLHRKEVDSWCNFLSRPSRCADCKIWKFHKANPGKSCVSPSNSTQKSVAKKCNMRCSCGVSGISMWPPAWIAPWKPKSSPEIVYKPLRSRRCINNICPPSSKVVKVVLKYIAHRWGAIECSAKNNVWLNFFYGSI